MDRRISEYLKQDGAQISCIKCGKLISDDSVNWKQRANVRERLFGKKRSSRSSDGFVLREFICPGCGALLETEVGLRSKTFVTDSIDTT